MLRGEQNYFWGKLIIEELSRLPICLFAIAPGSRSGPLTVMAAQKKSINTIIHLDERALGFYALGCAKVSGKPAVIITTSGSAVANLMPAVVEASLDNIPLIILTSDRPLECYDTAANQTMDQIKFFGNKARWFFDVPGSANDVPIAMLLTTVDHAYHKATLPFNNGPVHINCHFSEPLLPEPDFSLTKNQFPLELHNWHDSTKPFTNVLKARIFNMEDDYALAADIIAKAKTGLVILGKCDDKNKQIADFLKVLQWPVFTDISSQFKIDDLADYIITQYDLMLLSLSIKDFIKPDVIMHIGGKITSKRLNDFIANKCFTHYIKVQDTLTRDDEFHKVSLRYINISYFCIQMLSLIKSKTKSLLLDKLHKISKQVLLLIKTNITKENNKNIFNEALITYKLSQMIPDKHNLFIGNSMPIRNMQMYSAFKFKSPHIFVNRGISGIDGLIATACGCGTFKPTTVFIGDISALHDLNSLILAAKSKKPIILVIVNNDGGQIFSFLPISKWLNICIPFFIVPHGYNFKAFAKGFKLNYAASRTINNFVKDYQKALTGKTSTVIECKVNNNDNLVFNAEIQKQISALLTDN